MEEKRTNWDKIGANMNQIRTKTLINEADVVVVRFGEKYRQWNAAFDAGYAAAMGSEYHVISFSFSRYHLSFFHMWSHTSLIYRKHYYSSST